MGKPSSSSLDLASVSGTLSAGSLDATGSSAGAIFLGGFNLTLSGTWVGTVALERSFDGGTTWVTASTDSAGTASAYTANCSVVVWEIEAGVNYRVTFTRTSGTVVYRLSQTAPVIIGGAWH